MRRMIDYFFEHKKTFLVMALLLALNIVLLLFFTTREYKLYNNTESEIQNIEKELKKTKRKYKKVAKIVNNVKTVRKQIKTLNFKELKTLEKDFPRLTGKIYDILTKYGINFQHISYSKKLLRGVGVYKVVIHIPLKTTYFNFRRCLNDLEAIPFPVVIDKISVNAVEAASVSASVDLVVYYKKEKK